MRYLLWVYRLFLHLYPEPYRVEFGDEMQLTTHATLEEARSIQRGRFLITWLRELANVIPNAAREHFKKRAKMNIPHTNIERKPRWFFYAIWVVLNTATLPLAFFLSLAVMKVVTKIIGGTVMVAGVEHITEDYLFEYAIFPIWGLLIGLTQYAILKSYIRKFGLWIVLCGVIWPATSMILALASRLLSELWGINYLPQMGLSLVLVTLGTLLSILQWLMLRRRLKFAWIWVAFTVLGWLAVPLYIGSVISQPWEMTLLTLFPSITTGIALWFLFFLAPIPAVSNT